MNTNSPPKNLKNSNPADISIFCKDGHRPYLCFYQQRSATAYYNCRTLISNYPTWNRLACHLCDRALTELPILKLKQPRQESNPVSERFGDVPSYPPTAELNRNLFIYGFHRRFGRIPLPRDYKYSDIRPLLEQYQTTRLLSPTQPTQ